MLPQLKSVENKYETRNILSSEMTRVVLQNHLVPRKRISGAASPFPRMHSRHAETTLSLQSEK
jgi:hypothetical protein